MDNRPKTIFLDIDGTLFFHFGTLNHQITKPPKLLPGVLEKLHEWDRKGYKIILTTGRRESSRTITEKQLQDCGIFFDQLIMGVTGGQRVLINDLKQNSDKPTALIICPKRNEGIEDINI